MGRIEPGDLVKDKISGLEGIVTGITIYLYGCRRLIVQVRGEQGRNEGAPTKSFYIDEPQAELLQAGVIRPVVGDPVDPGGPRDEPQDTKHPS